MTRLPRMSSHGKRLRRAGAFTLIELLLVLVILAVLAGIVLPWLVGRGEQAKEDAALTQISNFATALGIFEVDNGRFPTTQEGLRALAEQPPGLTKWKKLYPRIPNDPWGNAYGYRSPGQYNTDSYDLYSSGPNGQEGDEDDITNWSTP
ncbi:MAG: type II secretion system major pseudopilin GspG [Phycisphaeraceae bacterium]